MFRIYVERKNGFQNEAERLFAELTEFVGVAHITAVRFLNRYDIEGINAETGEKAAVLVFSEPQSDVHYIDIFPHEAADTIINCEYVSGQYDQRADSAEQCLSLLSDNEVRVRCAKVYVCSSDTPLSENDIERIQSYLINPVDSCISADSKPLSLQQKTDEPDDIVSIDGFITMPASQVFSFRTRMSLAMDTSDVLFMQDYFKGIGRNPTETEVRVLDTYWSDHCRHTTFTTALDAIQIDEGIYKVLFERALAQYVSMRDEIQGVSNSKPITLMDMATIAAKYLKKKGKLKDIELSDEINACSIYIDVVYTDDVAADKTEKWLLMFKNETHNHPTEIEPFGGAATCIGGAIRDPLSGRAWVYQALRVTGAADPRLPISQTIAGKLPQIKLTREAANGFSSYGNQIGLTTGQVCEIYHDGFAAKRMELGAVIAAAPASQVLRETPEAGDVVILLGGGTGRDGIGGATGSSKVHTADSVKTSGAEVQKGNAVEERKIQRLFRNPAVSARIRRCNDFGAGGVAVAVGELASGLHITLDAVPKKYEGLNGTELAISESQERMAVVVRKEDVAFFIEAAQAENVCATCIAEVTDTARLVMTWRGKTIVDLDRAFLDTAGAKRSASARIMSPVQANSPVHGALPSLEDVYECIRTTTPATGVSSDMIETAWQTDLADLAVCSQRGLCEKFDGTIGSASVLLPFGGRTQGTPEVGMAAKIPSLRETSTASIMTYGYDPRIAEWSPYHGALIAVLHSAAKVACLGGDISKIRLTFQEYFERTSSDIAWGKPVSALLGALDAQCALDIAAIGGKDSMSGSFNDMHVPPTLVSFAVLSENASHIIGGSFQNTDSSIIYIPQAYTQFDTPDFELFKKHMAALYVAIGKGDVIAAYPIAAGGLAEALSKMAFGNEIGFEITDKAFCSQPHKLFTADYGSILVEIPQGISVDSLPKGWQCIGHTCAEKLFRIAKTTLSLSKMRSVWESSLALVFPPLSREAKHTVAELPSFARVPVFAVPPTHTHRSVIRSKAKPAVLIPVFPGTNCEYDMKRAFDLSGARTELLVFRNHSREALHDSIQNLTKAISRSQIIAFAGGFSAGDEPDGSGKFIANVLRHNAVSDALLNLIAGTDSLILGICNGFQALIKVGLVPYGTIMPPSEDLPTLTHNTIARHVSRMVRTKRISSLSPWGTYSLSGACDDTIHTVAVSHGEGRVIISESCAENLFAAGQIFSQYVDEVGMPTMEEPYNPNGSYYAIEGMSSPDGRILGKMAHNERTIGLDAQGKALDILKNVPGNMCENIFAAGVAYFQ